MEILLDKLVMVGLYLMKFCEWTDNHDLLTSDYATFPTQFNVTWNIPDQFSRIDNLVIISTLWDSYGQKVTTLSSNERFIVSLTYSPMTIGDDLQHCFILDGQDVEEFHNDLNGDSILEFNIKPTSNCSIYDKIVPVPIQFDLTLKYVNNFGSQYDMILHEKFSAQFLNPVYSLPFCIVLFGHFANAFCTLCILITAFIMFRYRAHPIIKGSRITFM